MFLGQFYHNIDEKGRLTVPARYREQLTAEGCVLLRGVDKNLLLMPFPLFEQFSQKLRSFSVTKEEARVLRRLFFGDAFNLELDRAGRVLIPAQLRKKAGLGSEAVLVGVGDYIEIWSVEEWKRQAEMVDAAQQNADSFSTLDLSTF